MECGEQSGMEDPDGTVVMLLSLVGSLESISHTLVCKCIGGSVYLNRYQNKFCDRD